MFKKIAALGAAAALCVGLMSGCGAASTTATNGYSAENPLVLTLAHGLSETHTVHIAMTQFAEEVNEKTDGRIQVKIFPNGQLGSENENLEQLQAGVIAMTKVSAPGLATYNEAFNAFGLPYIFNDTADFYNVMDSQEMQDFFLSTGDDGFVTLTYYTSGARSFYTKDKAIRTPADLKGLKIRVPGTAADAFFSALGASTMSMPFSEVYSNLDSGMIEAAEAALGGLYDYALHEVAKYVFLSEHSLAPACVAISSSVWNELTPENQKILKDALVKYGDIYTQKCLDLNDEYRAKMEEAGVTFVEPSAEDIEAMKAAGAASFAAFPELSDGLAEKLAAAIS